ncbi:MAG: hypothetical protein ACTTKL_02885 [Treponema sp.]
MTDDQLKNKIVEIYQIVSQLCALGLSKIDSKISIVEETNRLTEPMRKYKLGTYTNNSINSTIWNSYSSKLKELIDELIQRGWIK